MGGLHQPTKERDRREIRHVPERKLMARAHDCADVKPGHTRIAPETSP
jgi:hypothetical protein